ncbi:MAG: hypothetical protein M1829_002282 [Trizodia sp. TS-e1964]|nr:MAG: hypothetical protein M1829_002282 [Trizodia sp. TS-e1964]
MGQPTFGANTIAQLERLPRELLLEVFSRLAIEQIWAIHLVDPFFCIHEINKRKPSRSNPAKTKLKLMKEMERDSPDCFVCHACIELKIDLDFAPEALEETEYRRCKDHGGHSEWAKDLACRKEVEYDPAGKVIKW